MEMHLVYKNTLKYLQQKVPNNYYSIKTTSFSQNNAEKKQEAIKRDLAIFKTKYEKNCTGNAS